MWEMSFCLVGNVLFLGAMFYQVWQNSFLFAGLLMIQNMECINYMIQVLSVAGPVMVQQVQLLCHCGTPVAIPDHQCCGKLKKRVLFKTSSFWILLEPFRVIIVKTAIIVKTDDESHVLLNLKRSDSRARLSGNGRIYAIRNIFLSLLLIQAINRHHKV